MKHELVRILAIESSCDETSASVISGADSPAGLSAAKAGEPEIETNIIASQIDIHKLTNGVVPEVAARAHAEKIIPVIEQALGGKIKDKIKNIQAIAVTYGPGLIGSLLVGVEAAKTLSFANNLPLIPVNHLEGHIYAALVQNSKFEIRNSKLLPALALVVSGGHTELVLMKGHGSYEIVGQTLDDAAGEAFDKVATLLGLPYPGGPQLSKLAASFLSGTSPEVKGQKSNVKIADQNLKINTNLLITNHQLPRPMLHSPDLNFSFSGLKTAVVNLVKDNSFDSTQDLRPDFDKAALAAEFEQAVVDVLVAKTQKAALNYEPKSILLTGGVSANSRLRQAFQENFGEKLRLSPIELSGDNAGMIGLAAWYRLKAGKIVPWQEVNAEPNAVLG